MGIMEMITDFFPMEFTPAVVKKGKFKKEEIKNMSKDQFKKAKADHKTEIAKIKAQRAKLKADIKTHKLLIKQARIMYKVTKMKGSK